MDSRNSRARAIQDSIRRVLLKDWDPIGIQDEPNAQDEYDSYVGGVYRLLVQGASPAEVADHLATVEREAMGLKTEADALLRVATRHTELDVSLAS